MTVQVLFEVRVTPDEPLHDILVEVDKMPHWDREEITAKVMIERGTQILQEVAAARAIDQHYRTKNARAKATRAARRARSEPAQEDRDG